MVCGVVSGRKPDRWGQPTGEPAGFYEAKAFAERLLAAMHVRATFEGVAEFAFLPGRTAAIAVEGRRIGTVGQVHPKVAAHFDIEREVAMFELDLEALLPWVPPIVHFRPVPAYPSVEQDLAIVIDDDVPAARALDIIRGFSLVRSASIFDVYTGPPVPPGRKSIAFSISFGSDRRTLEDKDVRKERERIIARLRQELNAELRAS
jgi:phenylalanyl-tRNA synthetase beta chain